MTDRAGDDAVGRRVQANVDAVRERMAAACEQAGRPPADVRLVAVTKYVDAAVARLVAAAGCADLAESRPQRLAEMAVALVDVRPEIRWHLVGHLQRNKVRKTLPFAPLVHTLDSLRLLDALEAESERQLIELIRRRLALPLEKRMNFLRKRLPGGGSCL